MRELSGQLASVADARAEKATRRDGSYAAVTAAGVFVLQTAASGIASYGIPVFVAHFLQAGVASAQTLGVASSCASVAGALSGLAFGRTGAARYVPVLAASGALAAVALVVIGLAPGAVTLIAGFMVFGIMFNGSYLVVGTAILVRAYEGRATSGMALATAGSSAGGVFVSPAIAAVLGWQVAPAVAMGLIAAGFAVLVAAGVVVVARHDGHFRATTAGRHLEGSSGGSLRQHWPLVAGVAAIGAAQVGGLTYAVAAVAARGLPLSALVVTAMTVAGMCCRWLGSAGIRAVGVRWWALACYVGQAAGLALIAVGTSWWVVLPGAVLVGQSLGNTMLLRSQIVVSLFGLAGFTRRFSQYQTMTAVCSGSGPLLVSAVIGLHGSYQDAYLALAGLTLAAVPLLVPWILREKRPGPGTPGS